MQHVHSTEQLQLERSVMSDTPNADGHRYEADKDQGDKDKYPNVSARLQIICDQQLEHQ